MEWEVAAVVYQVAGNAVVMVLQTQGQAVTKEEEEDKVSVKVSWKAETAKGFSFWITFHRRWVSTQVIVSSLT